jgi:homogentisate 1,2-dioxygenase
LSEGSSPHGRVYHGNIDYDEVLFYSAGHFFSRDGIGAVMVDAFCPLKATPAAELVENPDYWASWK